jgi:hypothetical protein
MPRCFIIIVYHICKVPKFARLQTFNIYLISIAIFITLSRNLQIYCLFFFSQRFLTMIWLLLMPPSMTLLIWKLAPWRWPRLPP